MDPSLTTDQEQSSAQKYDITATMLQSQTMVLLIRKAKIGNNGVFWRLKGVLSDFDIGCVQIAYDSLISLVTFIFENIISCRSGSISDIPKTSQTKS